MKLLYTLSLALLCVAQWGYSQSYYANTQVLDPQRPWNLSTGTLEEVIYTVRPKGLFTEVGLFLTVSADDANYSPGRNLEAVIQFELPEGAIINDSWLWIDTIIIKGDIIDRWTASTIYEDIVDRNQDPSILYKNGSQDYELRIFPMASDSSRRVKLNMLIPGTWGPDEVGHFLPVNFSRSGYSAPDIHRVRYFPEPGFSNPNLKGRSENPFVQDSNESGELYYEYNLDGQFFDESQPFIISQSPMENGVFLQTYERDSEQFYELALQPDAFLQLDERQGRKLLVLVQHEPGGSLDVTTEDVLDAIHNTLSDRLTDQDSFAIMLAGLQPILVTDGFQPARQEIVNQVFSDLTPSQVGTYNLSVLLSEGLETAIQNPGRDRTKILLVANSQDEGTQERANQLLSDLRAQTGDVRLPIYVANTRDRRENSVQLSNGTRVFGNTYFYDNLVRIFGGSHRKASDGNSLELITDQSQQAISRTGTFDLYTTLRDGFSYQRFNHQTQEALIPVDQPLLQSGKYVGTTDFYIEAAVNTEGTVHVNGLEIPLSSIRRGDDAIADSWTSAYIRQLQASIQKPEIIQEIIALSIAERVLSEYTAFLCLEPAQGGEPCTDCIDDSRDDQTTATENPLDTLIDLSIFPNPFRSQVSLSFHATNEQQLHTLEVRVVNAMGQVVQTWFLKDVGDGSSISLQWDGLTTAGREIPAGIYQVLITDGVHQKAWRLIKQ